MSHSDSLFDLSGEVAVVTGSTTGIGKAIACRMAEAGAHVVVSSRKADVCDAVAAEINEKWARNGAEAVSCPAHVGHKDQLQKLVDCAVDRWGKLTIAVPNAAANPYYGPIAGIPDSAFDKIMETNIRSTHWLCMLALPHMEAAGSGSIVIIASIAGLKGNTTLGAYAISKVAEHQIARNIAVEYGPKNIRANAIARASSRPISPGRCGRTRCGWRGVNNALPLRRIGDPDEIGSVAVFLASRAASYVTGQVINVCGGAAVV